MVFANWALVIVTMVLALITFFYMRHTKRMAYETKRMADVMVRDYETRIMPLLDIQVKGPSHSSQGFEIPITISNLGNDPIKVKKLVMKWWYKNHPEKVPQEIPKEFDVWLKRNDPVTALFLLGDGQIKNSEIPESQNLNGVHLGAIVAASFWLEFHDNKTDKIQSSKEKTRDPLC